MDHFVESLDGRLVHRFRRIAVQLDRVVVERQIPVEIARVPRVAGALQVASLMSEPIVSWPPVSGE
jgi:hypothetical protein